MVPNTNDDLPDPEMPVNTVSRRLGISTLTSLRLFSRAPCTRIRSWLSATAKRSLPSRLRRDESAGCPPSPGERRTGSREEAIFAIAQRAEFTTVNSRVQDKERGDELYQALT